MIRKQSLYVNKRTLRLQWKGAKGYFKQFSRRKTNSKNMFHFNLTGYQRASCCSQLRALTAPPSRQQVWCPGPPKMFAFEFLLK